METNAPSTFRKFNKINERSSYESKSISSELSKEEEEMTLANTKDKSRILSYRKFPEKKSLPKKDSLPEKDNRPRVPIKPKISSKKIEVKRKESTKKLVVVKSNSNPTP